MSRQTKAFRKGVKVSERHGAGEWVQERLSSLILIPLTLWGLWSGLTLSGAGYDAVLEWFRSPINSGLLIVTLLTSLWHMQMGVTVIVDDYIHRPLSRNLIVGAVGLLCLLLAAASVFFIVRLALGSAPLPAGFGI